MWSFSSSAEDERRRLIVTLAVGTTAGLAIGALLAGRRGEARARELGTELRSRVGRAAARLAPDRRVRTVTEETELARLEDAVIDAFLADATLSERGIDVGAISHGIVELTGSVQSEDEADLAVRVANTVADVQTVVNRLEVESEARQREATRRRFEAGDPSLHGTHWEGRRVGMGRTRQGLQTEPDRPDDSQKQVERALEQADRRQWEEEALAAKNPRMSDRPEDERRGPSADFDEDELDNQDPHAAANAAETLDEQPQRLRSLSRVGEGLKPGTELRLEDTDLPLKPHSDIPRRKPSPPAGEE